MCSEIYYQSISNQEIHFQEKEIFSKKYSSILVTQNTKVEITATELIL